jgi:hypothetical protein
MDRNGQRDGEEREERPAERGETTWGGRWSISLSALPVSDHLLHRSIPIPRRKQKDICARLNFKEYPNFTERMCPRNVGGGISQRYEEYENIVKNGNQGKEINITNMVTCP